MLQKSVAVEGLQDILQQASEMQTFLEACPEEIDDPSVVDKFIEMFHDVSFSAIGTKNDISLLHHENRCMTELNTW